MNQKPGFPEGEKPGFFCPAEIRQPSTQLRILDYNQDIPTLTAYAAKGTEMFKHRFPVVVCFALALAMLACQALSTPGPEVKWDTSPDKVVIRATFCCGFVPQGYALNYIPDVQVWGDGRIIWVQTSNSGERRVLEGHLTETEMKTLLQRVADDGFFGWKDNYADYTVTDVPSQCLSVEFASQSKSVCEYYQGAPQAFHELYAYIASGAGTTGADFVPAKGYLTAYPQTFSGPAPQPDLHWPADSLGFSLSEAVGGRWAEGEALELAWRVVNTKLWGGVVQDGEAYYQLTIQVPGVSQNAPPAP